MPALFATARLRVKLGEPYMLLLLCLPLGGFSWYPYPVKLTDLAID